MEGPEDDDCLSRIQLRESSEYAYALTMHREDAIPALEPRELFDANPDGTTGRLKTRNLVGLALIELLSDEQVLASGTVEIQAWKLSYRQEYRWMLNQIAERAAELTLQRFAPSVGSLRPDLEGEDARSQYQRFAFLHSLILDDEFQAAMSYVQERPHSTWQGFAELRSPAAGIPASSRLARQIGSAKQRTPAPAGIAVSSLPSRVLVERHEETTDTVPNRFVAFALRGWRDLAADIRTELERTLEPTAASRRGIRETTAVVDRLDGWLGTEPLRSAGPLTAFPANDQVLQRKVAYRDIFRAFLLIDVVARIDWSGGADVFQGGRKDVAKLYELWCFVQLAGVVEGVCTTVSRGLDAFIQRDGSKAPNFNLASGAGISIEGVTERLGRRLKISLWLNRTFKGGEADEVPASTISWTREMRPDYSLRISVDDDSAPAAPPHAIWIHFDAKYRVAELGSDDDPALTAKRSDLLKMHAYRDAVAGSAGSYVLYPGGADAPIEKRRNRELLPGLGAFSLRPESAGHAGGSEELASFVSKALDHVADQASQHERAEFWSRAAYRGAQSGRSQAVNFLHAPPADTAVTLGYVKSSDHYHWILSAGMYNVRADAGRQGRVEIGGAILTSQLVVLYGPDVSEAWIFARQGEPVLMGADQLSSSGYPRPRGQLYFCLPIERLADDDLPHLGQSDVLQRLAASLGTEPGPRGAPRVCPWDTVAKVLRAAQDR